MLDHRRGDLSLLGQILAARPMTRQTEVKVVPADRPHGQRVFVAEALVWELVFLSSKSFHHYSGL